MFEFGLSEFGSWRLAGIRYAVRSSCSGNSSKRTYAVRSSVVPEDGRTKPALFLQLVPENGRRTSLFGVRLFNMRQANLYAVQEFGCSEMLAGEPAVRSSVVQIRPGEPMPHFRINFSMRKAKPPVRSSRLFGIFAAGEQLRCSGVRFGIRRVPPLSKLRTGANLRTANLRMANLGTLPNTEPANNRKKKF